jgi:hypothetical protein
MVDSLRVGTRNEVQPETIQQLCAEIPSLAELENAKEIDF